MNLTDEQKAVVDTVLSKQDNKIISVNSVAGSGKTRTADAVIKAYKPKNGFYTAFNKAIVKDSAKRFGKDITAKTIHALAYQFIKPSRTIEELNYLTIKEDLPYEDKAIVISTLDDFFRSSSDNIYDYVENHCKYEELREYITKYGIMMLNDEIPPSFNYLLKCLHLMLLNKEIKIDFDLFILDEVQDVTSVSLEIFKLINAESKVMFGDTHQNIYSFMNTVNAFEELKDTRQLRLTKSFRCSEDIANNVEQFGIKYLNDGFKFKGHSEISPKDMFNIAYITRTNGALIERMFDLINNNESFKLTRSVDEIFALPMALISASQGKPVYDKRYKFLEKEYKIFKNETDSKSTLGFYEYILDITDDYNLKNTVKIISKLSKKGINIYSLREKVKEIKNPNPNVILTTAHAFKGLEMDIVHIEDDLNASVNRAIIEYNKDTDELPREVKEDLNTYYVALSRARTTLLNVNYMKGNFKAL